jgi:choice-of-anchor B domain-containing protein
MHAHRVVSLVLASVLSAVPAVAQSFGSAVAVGDREVFIGEPLNQYSPGVVYIYRADGAGQWKVAAQLTAADAQPYDHFGRSIAWDGSTLLVGATTQDSSRGAAYVFARDADGTWRQTARLTGTEARPDDALGRFVALAGDLALVSAWGSDSGRGAVYVFHRGASGWTQEARLTADDGKANDFFGSGVAIVGDRLAIGAAQKDSAQGAVYLFRRDSASGQWRQEAMVKSRAPEPNARFGSTIVAHDGQLFVAAPGTARFTGAVSVLALDPETGRWNEGTRLFPFEARFSQFGAALAFDGDAVWIGGPGSDGREGRVFRLWRDSTGSWTQAAKLAYPDLESGDAFGGALAIRGTVAVVGLTGDDFGAGTATILTKGDDGTWTTGAKVWSETKGLSPVVGGQVDCTGNKATIFGCNDVDLLSFLPVSAIGGGRGVQVNDMWGWTDPRTGHEYALIGRIDGTAFVDVTDPQHPVYVGQLPKTAAAHISVWRDIKVYKNYAFIVSDGSGNHGVQIFDLTHLRNARNLPVTFTEDAHYDRIHSAHNIVIDTATGYAYTVGNSEGGETCGGGLHMINIQDPKHPTFAGCFADPATGRAGTGYTHDAQCVVYHGPDKQYQGREICFNSSETALGIADVTDKAHPKALARGTYPNVGYTHQGWLTDDQRYFYMDDELDELQGLTDGTRTLIWDVSDLEDPVLAAQYISKDRATDHNLYVRGHYVYESNYVSGLRILDISNPKQPVEVGYFDTVPVGEDAPGFGGSWSNYPFFKSGTIVVTSMQEGIFMLRQHPRAPLP